MDYTSICKQRLHRIVKPHDKRLEAQLFEWQVKAWHQDSRFG